MTPSFRFAHATGQDWQETARRCLAQLGGPPASLGFLYVTDLLADNLGGILDFFRQRTGVPHWVGTVGIGICATAHEYHDEPALAVMLGEFAPDSYRVFSGVKSENDLGLVSFKCGERAANFAIVHADPRNGEVPGLITGIAGKVEAGVVGNRIRRLETIPAPVDRSVCDCADRFRDQSRARASPSRLMVGKI